MAASKNLSPAERSARARLAAHASWAKTADRTARTAAAKKASPASVDYWLKQVDPDGAMDPEARRLAAESAYKAHMAKMSFEGLKARRAKKAAGK